ncbi:proline dehydrogenase family protein [Chthonomonas calidirosea]|uniref:proline dehydrogenase n=1 Tax=Chthonomonas calidirosea (strain DSM 23976 / ICMP 18418 / T49) TaxID=1303518 RepID=S0ESJ0_CHTCT|nr:proline dehydrogenase family protein [Chthonomonas calidirosea]CCW34204.1 L-proline dehydrogenase [Chthonomonas calidirosea T49]CEK14290.1 L-proline dehydrogenase [Chthonomonas calidirosea]CEK15461.1 L-proline dehydrogenase [Chthonomonas calidirosea]
MLTRTLLLQMAQNRSLETFARKNSLAARLARRFIAGETLEEIVTPVRMLNQAGMTVTLNYLGESLTSAKDMERMVITYLDLMSLIRREQLKASISLKLTSLGLDMDPKLAQQNLEHLVEVALPDIFIRIDMEGSAYTQTTLDIFYTILKKRPEYRNHLGVVIQAYLYRSEADIEELIRLKARVRLCKGAYKEPPSIAFQKPDDIRANYLKLMQRLLLEGNYPALATHDLQLINAAKLFANEHNISKDRFEFQMLYGVRRPLQQQIAKEGYNIRIYTPFGDHWYPYTMRRLAERPANLWFALQSIVRK